MVSHGIFVADSSFARPRWVFTGKPEVFCGIKPARGPAPASETKTVMTSAPTVSATDVIPPYPPFDIARDGPLLDRIKQFDMETSAGLIRIELDPALAPIHATRVAKLLLLGAYEGTTFYRYQADFLLQLSPVDVKAPGQPALPSAITGELRRLPLETRAQKTGADRHEKWMLSMARYDRDDTAVSSFCLMLGAASHLDGKYTLIGRVVPDDTTKATVARMGAEWSNVRLPFVLKVRERPRQAGAR
jgi:cyclophilin family peptidyl-prolyl cis-trans isomerase